MTEANREKSIFGRHLVAHEDQKLLPEDPKAKKVSFVPSAVQENGGVKCATFLLWRLNYIIRTWFRKLVVTL